MAQAQLSREDLFQGYDTGAFFDEMFSEPQSPRPHYARIFEEFAGMRPAQFEQYRQLADFAFLLQGVTFTVYSDGQGTERLNSSGRGDLIIHVTVETPSKLEPDQEELLRQLAKLRGEEAPPGKFAPGQQGLFSRLRDAFNGR